MRAMRRLIPAFVFAISLVVGSRAPAAPTIDESMECMLAVFGDPGVTDQCSVTLVTDKTKAELDKKPHDTFRLKIRSEAMNAHLKTLAKIPWLRHLEFDKNDQITDLSPLSGLKELRRLHISELGSDKLTSLSAIGSLTELEVLEFNGPQIEDISAIKNLKKLTSVSLPYSVSDATPLAGLTSLKSIWSHGFKDFAPLAGLTKLERLKSSTKGKDLKALAKLTAMRDLSVAASNDLNDLSGVEAMTSLEILYLNFTKVSDVTPLANCTKLKLLHLYSTPVTSIAPLAKITTLEDVDLDKTKIKDFTPLKASAKSLKHLAVPEGTTAAQVAMLVKENLKLSISGLPKK